MTDHQPPEGWNERIAQLPGTHYLQTGEWGRVKRRVGWQPQFASWAVDGETAAAGMLLVRRIRMQGMAARVSVAYVPMGPLLDWSNGELRARVLADLIGRAKREGAIFLKVDPRVVLGRGVPGTEEGVENPAGQALVTWFRGNGWVFSQDQIQYRNTVIVGLEEDEDELLARMKQKTRYNVRLAGRRGVAVRAGTPADFNTLFAMYAQTSARDGFVIRERAYYLNLWQIFWDAGMLDPLIAEVNGAPVAAVCIFRFAGTATYMHGMSTGDHREKMPTYLLQWEAMRRAKAAGCFRYDMWGAPDVFEETDSLWGVYRFKAGFGGQVVRHVGAWDYPIRPLYYRLYTGLLPRVLGWMRRRAGHAQ